MVHVLGVIETQITIGRDRSARHLAYLQERGRAGGLSALLTHQTHDDWERGQQAVAEGWCRLTEGLARGGHC
jgi:hypothetical protein